jgi:hypothetical protein
MGPGREYRPRGVGQATAQPAPHRWRAYVGKMTNEPGDTSEAATVDRAKGWGSDEVVRDHGDSPSGETGWGGREVVRDHEKEEETPSAGWSGDEVVRDQGEDPRETAGGWSSDEIVKDAGESATTIDP